MGKQPLGSNAFTASQAQLDSITTKYNEDVTNYYVTNPKDGSSGFVIDLRRNWKTYSKAVSQSYMLYLQRTIYQSNVYESMSQLKVASNDAAGSSALQDARKSLSSVREFTNTLSNYKSDMYSILGQGDSMVDYTQLGFSLYFGMFIACVGSMLLGTLFFACCGYVKCKCLTHFGWCVLTFWVLLGLLLSAIFFPVSVVLIEACGVTDVASLRQGRGLIPSSVWSQVDVCLVGNGDLYVKYDLDQKISFARKAGDSFELVTALYDPTKDILIYNVTDLFVANVSAS
jgi:hypothetical protein